MSFKTGACLATALLLAACATSDHRAPVEDRNLSGARVPANGATVSADPAKPLPPGSENAGKPGYYTVKPGDTLIRVGLETGQNWRDIMRWNNLDNPNVLEVGQVLRVVPPATDPAGVATRPVTVARVESRPLDSKPGASAASAPAASDAPAVTPAPSASPAPAPAPSQADKDAGGINWMWPAQGPVIATFDEVRNKGLGISGKAGDPVYAAADGRVVYAGSGLRGYGNLVIVKHNNDYLTAYAHNQTLLVKEDQTVRRGQKIAEMGSTDTDRVKLHFEIRRQGKPVDPAKYLPPR
ncbi:peptidoglycan DD-metalloendopeptidase family protein [Caldimonas thermodepolymerans]|jgi:Membrane proteins related to metalloendopeptidases|nr:peptidoglycan DD-metalloendopeptidase family protein [Caldimonas thermodepolymerans]RDI03832.1 lipoprotein NlpD [Caldimonas thermodepolymerans]TCP09799.1 lipoprotein NlpD [Caldimonas thermodepolymerans]UZG45914.1 peptidoglycan DD-metalloendopeptidase family protein [Caldimonas thermodepolymerans]UZG49807.1 peptidoglycan DD-metalloendopeptidase family protein [Caldimonas thermodepolymerans]